MSNFLERYQQGEHVQVWQELVAMGSQVRTEPLFTEAYAVAQETMRRARHNIELLVERLKNIRFQFQDPTVVFVPTSPTELNDLTQFERKVGPVPLSLRAWLEQVGTVNFMGNHPGLSYYDSNTNPRFAIGRTDGPGVDIFDVGSLLQQMKSSDAVPSEVTDIFANFFGTSDIIVNAISGTAEAMSSDNDQPVSDPLVVELYYISLESYEEWQEYSEDEEQYPAIIAPDIFHKSGISGGDSYEIALPDARADAPLRNIEWGEMTFVEYLRLSFEWAGFPGLQEIANRDETLLALLKEGLLPL